MDEARRVGGEFDAVALPLKFAAVPVLSELSPGTLLEVIRAAPVLRLPAGKVVCHQGRPATSCYLIARGKVRVTRDEARGPREIATLAAGAVFGEMALISGAPRSASVTTVEETDLLKLGQEALAAMGSEIHQVAGYFDKLARRRWMGDLLHNPVFRVFDEENRRQLLQRFEALTVPRGTVLVEQGERAKGLYIVAQGQVSSIRRSPSRAPEILENVGPGAMPGLESILGDRPARTSAVTTSSMATLLFLPGRFFRRLTAAVPEVVRSLQAGGGSRGPRPPLQPLTPGTVVG